MQLLALVLGSRSSSIGLLLSLCISVLGCEQAGAVAAQTLLPAPLTDVAPNSAGEQTAVFSGGCFWGVQAVFQHVKGVHSAISGYAGGSRLDAKYEIVSSGTTRHAESARRRSSAPQPSRPRGAR